ncbi:MAG: hypothetical protein ACXWIP_01700 [Burkholderiales bacterium]
MWGILLSPVATAASAGVRGALDGTQLGLYEGKDFRLVDGRCADCPTIPQALWYFRGDMVAVPQLAPAAFAQRSKAQDDVREWALKHPAGERSRPPLVWIGSPLIAEGMRLDEGGRTMLARDGSRMAFSIVPKISTNLSYYDASSVQHFANRSMRLRGRMENDGFVARTIWPEDYALDFNNLVYKPLSPSENLSSLVRAESGGARLPLATQVIWQRDPKATREWAGKPVLAFILNGAQGDDDEAHGGHFAVVTGVFGPRGEWGDWLVNNFYNLDSVSEKGIIASTLPMDAYMADLNSGQSWYRPSYMLVAVLKQNRVPALYQEAIGRVYNHFYRHDFAYRHATANCAGISMQTLRSLGWNIPEEGPTSRAKALAALPYMTVKEMSLESGTRAYDYLNAEQTDLYPFVAFDAIGRDLLSRVTTRRATDTPYERALSEDLEALLYVRIPQFPSSRAFGQTPVASIDEYMKRAPADKAQWKIVPVAARPFPEDMKDPKSPADTPPPSLYAMSAYGGILGICAIGAWRRLGRRKTG